MATHSSDRPLRVLFVLENYFPNIGGVETLFKSLAEQLEGQGCQVTVVTTRLSQNDPAMEATGNLRIFRYRFFNRYLFTVFAFFPALFHARHCDLVHTTSYNAAWPAYLAAKLLGKKLLITFHEVWGRLWFELPFMGRMAKWGHFLFEQLLLRLRFDFFVGVSNSTVRRLLAAGVEPSRVRMIYNGIDYQDFNLSEPLQMGSMGRFTYTYFGRLGISKGLDLLLEAACLFYQKHPQSRLKLIVPTSPAPFLKQLLRDISDKGLSGHVTVLHHLPFEQLKTELAVSNCVVIPSYSEGFCFAAAESAALGVPIVSSGRAALPEVVSGRFIEMENLSAAAICSALEKARVGEWRHTPIQKFELKDTITAYLQLYGEIAGNFQKLDLPCG